MEETLPPGFRFHPTDEELITYYLTHKVSDTSFTSKAVADVDLNKCEPWDLPGKASMGVKEWYFFSLRDRKYPTGLRTNRATEAGYWKTTGKDKEIFRGGILVGMKKTLVFYRGRAPKGEKTNWVMHEYRLESKVSFKPTKEEWVVCRVFQKSNTVKKPAQQTPSSQPSLDSPCDTNTMESPFGDIELPNLNTIASSSSNVSLQNYNTDFMNTNLNMNLNMNWPAAATREVPNTLPPLSWPSSLLGGSNLSSVNALLLRALQLRNSHSNYSSFMPQGSIPQFGITDLSSNFGASSSRVLDNSMQQQQQQPQLQEQPFNLDSIW